MDFLVKALKDLLASEKGFLTLAMLVIAAIFVFTGKITPKEFFDNAQVVLGIYVVGKTASSVGAAVANKMGAKPEIK